MFLLFLRNATVIVNLENVNDNSPIFSMSTYTFTVKEVREAMLVIHICPYININQGKYYRVLTSMER